MDSDLDQKILTLQRSTKTQFKVFIHLHEWLKMNFRPYYLWSVKPYSRAVHWAILLIYISLMPLMIFGDVGNQQKHFVKAGDTPTSPKWQWLSPNPTKYALTDVDSVDANTVWVAGQYGMVARATKTTAKWVDIGVNNATWDQFNLGITETLRSIYADNTGKAWVAGDNGSLFYYNGTGWVNQTSGDILVGTGINLSGIDLNSINGIGNDVWVTGEALGGNALILHYDTTDGTWTRQTSNIAGNLCETSVVADNNVVAIGTAGILQYNGSWSTMAALPDTFGSYNSCFLSASNFHKSKGIFANGTDIWASAYSTGGTIGVDSYGEGRYIFQYDEVGGSWNLMPGDARGMITDGLPGDNNMLAIDYHSSDNIVIRKTIDGWANVYSSWAQYNDISAIWDATDTDGTKVWRVTLSGLALRLEVVSWSRVNTQQYIKVLGLSNIGSSLWIANDMPNNIKYQNGVITNTFVIGSTAESIYATNSDDVWIVSAGSSTMKFSSDGGATYGNSIIGYPYQMSIITGYGDRIWASGIKGDTTVFYTSDNYGASWEEKLLTGINVAPSALSVTADAAWALLQNVSNSNDDRVMRYNFASGEWTTYIIPGATDVIALGNYAYVAVGGTIKKFADGVWTDMDPFPNNYLVKKIAVADDKNIYALLYKAGGIGKVSWFNGNSWADLPFTETDDFSQISTNKDVDGNYHTFFGGFDPNTTPTPNKAYIAYYYRPAGMFAQNLVVVGPGESWPGGDGTCGGAGYSTTLRAGVSFPVCFYATDSTNVIDTTVTSNITISSNDPYDSHSSLVSLSSGQATVTINNPHKNTADPGWTYTFFDPSTGLGTTTLNLNVLVGEPSDFTFAKGSDYTTNPQPGNSRRLTVSNLVDVHGNAAPNDNGIPITFDGPEYGRFSLSETGGSWAESLTTTVPVGSTTLNLWYVDYQKGTSQIKATALGKEKTLDIVVDQGEIDPITSHVTLSTDSLNVGQSAQINTNLVDVNGEKVAGKMIKHFSSRSGDAITNPGSRTDANGNTVGSIRSNRVGDLTIATLDETDGVWLADHPKLITNPLPVNPNVTEQTITVPATSNEQPPADKSIIGQITDALRNSEVAKKIAEVFAPILATIATLSLLPLIANVIGGTPAALHVINYGISLALEAAGIRKRRKNWGKVYDSTSGKGIDLALVRLFDQTTMKLVGTIVTDVYGKYSFQPHAGTYVISVTKEGYIYPTQIFAQYGIAKINKNASRINNQYLGQPINLTDQDEFLNIDIPIDPVNEKAAFLLKVRIIALDVIDLIAYGLSSIFLPILAIGTLMAAFVAIVQPGPRNAILSVVYLVITLIYSLNKMIRSHKYCVIFDRKTKEPITGVVVSVFDKEHNTLKETRVTDKYGRFSIYAQPGKYYLKADKHGWNFDYKNIKERDSLKNNQREIYAGQTINLNKSGYIKYQFFGVKE